MGFKDGRKQVQWYMSANPTERHSMAVGGTMRRLHKRSNGNSVNAYQKPPYLSRHIVKSRLAPGSTVVVAVSGGGDVEGLISAGMNVVGFENDLEQCKELLSIWNKYESDYKEKQVLLGGARAGGHLWGNALRWPVELDQLQAVSERASVGSGERGSRGGCKSRRPVAAQGGGSDMLTVRM